MHRCSGNVCAPVVGACAAVSVAPALRSQHGDDADHNPRVVVPRSRCHRAMLFVFVTVPMPVPVPKSITKQHPHLLRRRANVLLASKATFLIRWKARGRAAVSASVTPFGATILPRCGVRGRECPSRKLLRQSGDSDTVTGHGSKPSRGARDCAFGADTTIVVSHVNC